MTSSQRMPFHLLAKHQAPKWLARSDLPRPIAWLTIIYLAGLAHIPTGQIHGKELLPHTASELPVA